MNINEAIENLVECHSGDSDIMGESSRTVRYELMGEPLGKLGEYLRFHESDIASSINDFGDLKAIFTGIVGKEPQKFKQ